MRRHLIALVVLAAAPSARAAVTFPPDAQWVPFHCGNPVMTDAFGDDAQFLLDLDLVGDDAHAAGYHAADAQYLYLRIRLDADPAPGGVLAAAAWGYEFDLDGNPATYEVLVSVDGVGAGGPAVQVYQNTRTTIANSPTDPADTPSLQTYPFAMNGRSIVAPGTMFGNDGDFFLDFAVPWSALVPAGLDHTTGVRVWAGSSTAADTLNGDLACHDATAGAPTLDGTASTMTPADPTAGGGNGQLVGGERCEVGGGGGLAVILALGFARRRRDRRRS